MEKDMGLTVLEIVTAVNKCESVGNLAGLLSTQNFTERHPEYAESWIFAIERWLQDNRPYQSPRTEEKE